jgi:TonB family protein
MNRTPLSLKQFLALSLFVALTGSSAQTAALHLRRRLVVVAQTAPQGIELYKAGKIIEAINALRVVVKRNEEDAEAWHYLGLALLSNGAKNDARKAFERAAKLRIDKLYVKYPNPPSSDEERTSRRTQAASRIKDALDSVAHYVALTSKPSDEWLIQLQNLQANKEYYEGGGTQEEFFRAEELTTRARVIDKPEPTYTSEARSHGITGTVVLRAVFSYDGTVRNIMVIRGLKNGLNERAIQAARQIKFIPATKDGKPVSMWMQLEYNFNLF